MNEDFYRRQVQHESQRAVLASQQVRTTEELTSRLITKYLLREGHEPCTR